MKKQTISAVIAVKNEEKNIKRCLESVKWVDEIMIIDSYSTDNTLKIAKKYNPTIYQFKKKKYLLREKLNFGIKKVTKNWILIIDADEEMTPKLKKEILQKINDSRYSAYNIYFQNYTFGRFLKGDYWRSMPVIRIFKNGKGKYTTYHPHTLLTINGEIGDLHSSMIHYTHKDTRHFLKMMYKYTDTMAPEIVKKRRGGLLNKQITNTGIFYSYIEPILFSLWIFFKKKMFKDHFIGLWLSILMGYYLYIERKKVKRLIKNEN